MAAEFDVVIAGCGIAGLSAALTSARRGRKTLVLAGDMLGGQLLSIAKIDGYPGFPEGIPGYDLCPMTQEQAVAAGAEFAATELQHLDAQDGRWHIVAGDGEAYVARGIVIATGAGLKALGVPGEERLSGKGVSHCASCDAPLLRGRTAIVVGGGDSAAQEALTLAEFAAKVIILQRGATLTAQQAYRDLVTAQPKIELRCNTIVEEILGDTNVTGARIRDASGTTANLDSAGVFVYIGLQPNNAVLNGRIALDQEGRVPTDGWMRTGLRGVCAAGAVRSGWLGRAAISAGDGATAALAIDRFLSDGAWRGEA